jgi:hypothetical protein
VGASFIFLRRIVDLWTGCLSPRGDGGDSATTALPQCDHHPQIGLVLCHTFVRRRKKKVDNPRE